MHCELDTNHQVLPLLVVFPTNMDSPNNNKRTRLDRSLPIVLSDTCNDTPSRRDGIDGATERLYRLYGAALLHQASQLLAQTSSASPTTKNDETTTTNYPCAMRPSTFLTAAVMFQRLYHRLSLRTLDVWAAAMGSLFCAAKTEEVPLTARQVIVVFVHLYRRRRLCLDQAVATQGDPCVLVAKDVAALDHRQRLQKLQTELPALSSTGPIWKEWFTALVEAEGQVLRALGFMLYWIPREHAHRFVPGFCQALQLSDNASVCQRIWNTCNDAYRLDLCVRFTAEVICTAAILVTLQDVTDDDQGAAALHGTAWWIPLIGPHQEQALADCANILLGLQLDNKNNHLLLSEVAFLKPLCKESFNGPDSFLWEMAEGNL